MIQVDPIAKAVGLTHRLGRVNRANAGAPSIVGPALVIAWLLMACGAPSPSVAPATSQARPGPQATPTAVSEQEMVEAINVRTRFGLRADEAWIREVASDPEAQVGINEFGIPLTPTEYADLMGRRWDEDLFRQVRGYGLAFPDDYAGAYINLKSSGVIIEFKQQVERHRRALSNLVADPSLVEVRDVEWSLRDLEGFMEEVKAEREWFDTVGLGFLQVAHNVNENFLHVDFVGPSEEAARVIEDHFGNPTWLRARWAGPPAWTGPRADLVIKVTDTRGRPVPNLWCEVIPDDPRVADEFGDTLFGTGPAGLCEFENLAAVAYRVRLHEWVDNDHYDPDPILEFGVVLPSTGKTVPITIPTS